LVDDILDPSETGDLWIVDENGEILARAEVPAPEVIAPPPLHEGEVVPSVVDWGAAIEVFVPWPEGAAAIVLGDDRIEYPPRLDAEIKGDVVVPDAVPLEVRGDLRWNVVFLAEGYTAREMSDFEARAREFVSQFSSTSPYREYIEFFNFWMVPTVSNTSGVRNTTPGDTPFGCHVEPITSALRCERRSEATVAAHAAVASANIVVIVVNNPWGARSVANGSARVVIMSSSGTHPTFVHEMGHIFELSDEYLSGESAAAVGVNCSRQNPGPWESVWASIDPLIGSFPGCGRSTYYRPTEDSCVMRNLNHEAFCRVCNEELVRRLPQGFFSASPVPRPEDGGNIPIGRTPPQFRVEYADIPTMRFQWTLDGTRLSTTGLVHTLDPCAFGNDTTTRHRLEVAAINDSPALRPAYRRPSGGRMQTWNLVGSSACGSPEVPEIPDAPDATEVPSTIQSAHPYASNLSSTFEVNAPAGTSRMRLRFSRIELETNYDFLEVRDARGMVVARYTGSQGETLTPEISGNRATLHLTTDGSMNRWGFALAAIVRVSETAMPIEWRRARVTIESPNPYPSNHTQSWSVSAEGATAVRLHFASFRTEARYDVVNVYDSTGTRVESYSGNLGEFVTNPFANPPLRVELRTDGSVTDQGFRIDWFESR
jgi:hypothetical protein